MNPSIITIPLEARKYFAEMGKKKIFNIKQTSINFEVNINKQDVLSLTQGCRDFLFSYNIKTPSDSLLLATYSDFFSQGIKCFSPTSIQCEALSKVEINLPITAFEQCFPSMLYEFPKEYINKLKEEFNPEELPKYVIISVMDECIIALTSFQKTEVIGFFPKTSEYTFEEGFKRKYDINNKDNLVEATIKVSDDDLDFTIGERCERIAINLALILTKYKTNIAWNKEREKHLKLIKKGKLFHYSDYQEVKFIDQNVTFHQTQSKINYQRNNDPQYHIKSHWRRGYWKHLKKGEHWKQDHNFFVPPVLVNKDYFIGNQEDTNYDIS